MCGITYLHTDSAPSAVRSVLKRYNKQRSRGTEGFGLVSFSFETRKINYFIRQAEEKEILKDLEALRAEPDGTNTGILFHHRNPTSTPNYRECAHPIKVSNASLVHDYYVVHNGIITNDDDLKPEHNKAGYQYTTEFFKEEVHTMSDGSTYSLSLGRKFNDSEALAIELALVIEGKKAKMEAKGSIAFVVIQASKDGYAQKLYWGRNNGSPLFLEKNKNAFCLKSEGDFHNSVAIDKLYCFDYQTKEITEKAMDIDGYISRFVSTHTPTRTETRSEAKRLMGFQPPEDDEEYAINKTSYAVPPMTFEQFLAEPSQMDYTVTALTEEQGFDLDELIEFTLQETYCAEAIREYERDILDNRVNVLTLNRRIEMLGYRLELLENRQRLAEAANFGIVPEDHIFENRLPKLGDGQLPLL